MAEGGFSLDSGENQKKNECEICFKEGRESFAKFVCQQCRQKLCPECKDYHSKSLATRSHNVAGILSSLSLDPDSKQIVSDMPSLHLGSDAIEPLCKERRELSSLSLDSASKQTVSGISSLNLGSDAIESFTCKKQRQDLSPLSLDSESKQIASGMSSLNQGSDEIETILCKKHFQEIKFFCVKHLAELCRTCTCMKHKNCQTVVTIEEAEKEIYSKSHGDKIIQSIRQLSEHFQNCRSAMEDSKSKLPRKKQMTMDSVRQSRRSVEAYLDRLETDALAEIDTLFDQELKALDEQINICNASISFLTASLSNLDRMMSVSYNEGKFVEINKVTKHVKQHCNMLLDLNHKMFDFDVKFKKNGKFSDFRGMFDNLGKSEVIKSPATCVTTASVPIYIGEMRANGAVDDQFLITSYDVLPDGRRILLDNSVQIQVYDENNIFRTETILPVQPYKSIPFIVFVNINEAVVSSFSDKLIKVTLNEDLVVAKTIVKHVIGSIARYGEDIIAWVIINDILHIVVMDKDGKIKRTIMKDEDKTLFKYPGFFAMNADETILFVVDGEMGCYGITIDGHILFQYRDPEADGYFGLAVGNDCLFLGVSHPDKPCHVQQINFSGVKERCHDFGLGFPLKVVKNELVLITRDEKKKTLINFYFLMNRKKDMKLLK